MNEELRMQNEEKLQVTNPSVQGVENQRPSGLVGLCRTLELKKIKLRHELHE